MLHILGQEKYFSWRCRLLQTTAIRGYHAVIKPARSAGAQRAPALRARALAKFTPVHHWEGTAVQLVFNPFSQLVPQLELYSQLQLSLWSDPIAFSVPKLT